MNTVVSAGRPGRIFISYRRSDTAYAAGWLYDRLSDRFGGGQVFKDVDSLQPGDDFVEKITLAVSSCDVLLAVIGPDWVTAADEEGKPRLGDPADFVRVEIEAALTRGIRVIPLLVEGARMPRVSEVPQSLSPLIRRHALELSPSRFNRDAEDLMGVLDKAVPSAAPSASAQLRSAAPTAGPVQDKPSTPVHQASAAGSSDARDTLRAAGTEGARDTGDTSRAKDTAGTAGTAAARTTTGSEGATSPMKSPPGRSAPPATTVARVQDRTATAKMREVSSSPGEPQGSRTTGSPTEVPHRRPTTSSASRTERVPTTEATLSGDDHSRTPSPTPAASTGPSRVAPSGVSSRAPTGRRADASSRSLVDETPTAVIDRPSVLGTQVSGAQSQAGSRAQSLLARVRTIRGRWWLMAVLALAVLLTGTLLWFTSGGLPQSRQPLATDVLVWRPQPANGSYRLATVDVKGQGERELTRDGPHDSSAVLSPDRRTVLFLKSNPENKYRFTLYAVAADGGRTKKLFSDGTSACPELHRPAWSSQGLLAVVCSSRNGRQDRLNVMTLDGTLLKSLDQGELGDPTFTSDGNSVVYWRNGSGGTQQGGALYQVATTGEPHPVMLTTGTPGPDGDPACSPVSDEVAFRHTSGKRTVIAIIRAGQGLQDYGRLLKVADANMKDPTWSPSGSQLAFRAASAKTSQIWVMNADGGAARPIGGAAEHNGPPAWTTR